MLRRLTMGHAQLVVSPYWIRAVAVTGQNTGTVWASGHGHARSLYPRGGAQLLSGVVKIGVDRPKGDAELKADRLARQTFVHKAEAVPLSV